MPTTTAFPSTLLAARLGPNPLPTGLAFWLFGVGFCLAAWQIHKVSHVTGSILLGLSTFVNFFCFVRGLNFIRRAVSRYRTIRKTEQLGLSIEKVYYRGGFIVIDDERGCLVCNGRAADYRTITKITCTSTWLLQKLELYGCGRMPIVAGFADRETLFAVSRNLRAAIRSLTGKEPEYGVVDEIAPQAPHPSTSDQG